MAGMAGMAGKLPTALGLGYNRTHRFRICEYECAGFRRWPMVDKRPDAKQEPPTLSEFSDSCAVKEDVLVRAQHGARKRLAEEEDRRRAELLRSEAALARRRRRRIFGIVFVCLAAAGPAAWLLSHTRDQATAPRPAPPSDVVTVSRTVDKAWILTKLNVRANGTNTFAVDVFDFDGDRFLKGKRVLDDAQSFRDAIAGASNELRDTWLLIFAGASVEGIPEDNLKLCRHRVDFVATMIAETIPGGKQRYWAIRAGEFKMTLQGHEMSEEEEDQYAYQVGEQVLSHQRRLILVSVKPGGVPADRSVEVVAAVARKLLEAHVLPREYDYADSTPVAVAPGVDQTSEGVH